MHCKHKSTDIKICNSLPPADDIREFPRHTTVVKPSANGMDLFPTSSLLQLYEVGCECVGGGLDNSSNDHPRLLTDDILLYILILS